VYKTRLLTKVFLYDMIKCMILYDVVGVVKMNRKYLWIGMCCSDEEKQHIVDCGGKILSSAVSQDNLTEGLSQFIEFDSINSFRLPYYPEYKEKKVTPFSWSRTGKSTDISVSYLNYKYLSLYFKKVSMVNAAREWARKHQDDDVSIIVYSMHSPFMAAADAVKKIIKNAKINLIVPDLPQYMDLEPSFVKKILKAIDWVQIKNYMKNVDKYILYSEHMAEFLGLDKGCWTVMEGAINENDITDEEPDRNEEKITVMYSGVCSLMYGLPELLDGFSLIEDENYELWITGAGTAEDLIKERAAKDKRIKFFGFLPSRQDLLMKQKAATMLINTRKPDEPASAYCFPSKLFEYMASANPVLSFDIPGIPREYFDYLVKMDDVTPQAIAEAIKSVAAMSPDDRKKLGMASRDFVRDNKNKYIQSKKILDFITEK